MIPFLVKPICFVWSDPHRGQIEESNELTNVASSVLLRSGCFSRYSRLVSQRKKDSRGVTFSRLSQGVFLRDIELYFLVIGWWPDALADDCIRATTPKVTQSPAKAYFLGSMSQYNCMLSRPTVQKRQYSQRLHASVCCSRQRIIVPSITNSSIFSIFISCGI